MFGKGKLTGTARSLTSLTFETDRLNEATGGVTIGGFIVFLAIIVDVSGRSFLSNTKSY